MNLSREELERALMRLQADITNLKSDFEKYKSYINDRFDLRNDLTQQNGVAIQTLSTRMDKAGIP